MSHFMHLIKRGKKNNQILMCSKLLFFFKQEAFFYDYGS